MTTAPAARTKVVSPLRKNLWAFMLCRERVNMLRETAVSGFTSVVVVIAIFATEIMSNLALVTIFVPIVAAFAVEAHYPILQLCLPLTLASSCAFMLPVGTPPNAIVFSSGLIKIHQMAKIGFILNLIATIIVCAFAFLFF